MEKKDAFAALANIKPGHTIGRYRVLYVLGQGSLGTTCKVVNTSSRQVSVIKVVPEAFCRSKDPLALVQEIGKLNKKLTDASNLLFIKDAELHTGIIALHMDLPTGILEEGVLALSLQRLKRNRGYFFTEKEILFTSYYILKGLKNLHNAGICHGNLKPRNILFHEGKVVLTDFGLNPFFDSLSSFESSDQQANTYTDYSSNESKIIQGFFHSHIASYRHTPCHNWQNREPSVSNDLFAAGIVISELVLRSEQYTGLKPSKTCEGIQNEWNEWIETAIHPDADKRFQNADAMIDAMPPPLDKPSAYTTIFDDDLVKQYKEYKSNIKDISLANKLRKSVAETQSMVSNQNNTRTVFKIKRKK